MSDATGRPTRPIRTIVIVILVALALLLLVSFRQDVGNLWDWIRGHLAEHAVEYVSALLGGFIASLTASVFVLLLTRREKKELKEYVVNSIEESFGRRIGALPDALGGPLTKSLLEYYPRTSRLIAQIISDITSDLYSRHYRRVAVTKGVDTYRLIEETMFSEGENECRVWQLEFHISWTWHNDTDEVLEPLKDLRFLIAAPDFAVDAFLTQPAGLARDLERDEIRKQRDQVRKHENVVWSTILHPGDAAIPVKDGDVESLYTITGVTFSMGGNAPTRVPKKHITPLPRTEMPPTVYAGFRLATDYTRVAMAVGETLTVEYKGRIGIPVRQGDGKYHGRLEYPPSDLVAEQYTLNMVYPVNMDVDGVPCVVSPDYDESGCLYLHDMIERVRNQSAINLPAGFSLGQNERAVAIERRDALTDLFNLRLLWSAEPVVQAAELPDADAPVLA